MFEFKKAFLSVKYCTADGVEKEIKNDYPTTVLMYDKLRSLMKETKVISFRSVSTEGLIFSKGLLRFEKGNMFVGNSNITEDFKNIPEGMKAHYTLETVDGEVLSSEFGDVVVGDEGVIVGNKNLHDLKMFEGQHVKFNHTLLINTYNESKGLEKVK